MKYLQPRGATITTSLAQFSQDTGLDEIAVTAPAEHRVHGGQAVPIDCPCCKQPVIAPSLEMVIDHYEITPLEGRILGAIWRGRGLPVTTERIFDAMYQDDPDGGPSPPRMYAAFKVALCHMRAKLKGSGISIVNPGYRRGYRLVLGEN